MIGNDDSCLICGQTFNLHRHHIFYGTANRKNSEKYGMVCMLCARHHNMSDEGVHFNHKMDEGLKRFAQMQFEREHSHEEFMEIFGRNYL